MGKSSNLRQLVLGKGIKHLYHFSPAGNLEGILADGLRSRADLDAINASYRFTDLGRWDERPHAVCVSIEGINEAMFERKKTELKASWVIFQIDASVLWTHECRFCWTNGAATEIVSHRGYLGGEWGFNTMFEDRPVARTDLRSYREVYERKSFQPTLGDAEVQVMQPIAFELVTAIFVKDLALGTWVDAMAIQIGDEKEVVVAPNMFG